MLNLRLKLNGNRSIVQACKYSDIGNNMITDTFPHWIDALSSCDLIGPMSDAPHPFPELRILDLSNNMFIGLLPSNYLGKLITMKNIEDDPRSHYIGENSTRMTRGYEERVVVIKGSEKHLERILTVFTIK